MENIGNKFRDYRQKRNLSIDEVSEKTKIRKHIVQALEDGNLSVLPPVYLAYFVKTYAGFLKMSASDINDILASMPGGTDNNKSAKPQSNGIAVDKKIDAQPIAITTEKDEIVKPFVKPFSAKSQQKSFMSKKKTAKLSQANIVGYLIYSALGLAVLSLIYFVFFSNGTSNISNFSSETDKLASSSDTAVIGAEASNTNSTPAAVNSAAADSLVLEARGIDTAWLRIVVDGVQSEQLVFYPEMERKWSAKQYVMLSVGNEGAIEFKRNGQVLKPFGKKRSVIRNVKITANDIVVSSSPWKDNKEAPAIASSSSSSSSNTANVSDKKVSVKKKKKKEEVKAEAPRLLEPSAIQKSFTPFVDKKLKR